MRTQDTLIGKTAAMFVTRPLAGFVQVLNLRQINALKPHTLITALAVVGMVGLSVQAPPASAMNCSNCTIESETGGGYVPGPLPKPPMLAFQWDNCLYQYGIDPQSLVSTIETMVNEAFAQIRHALEPMPYYARLAATPQPDVRVMDCVPYDEYTTTTNIAIWFKQPGYYGTADTVTARNNYTKNLKLIYVNGVQQGGAAIQVHAGAIDTFTSMAVAHAQRKITQATAGTSLANDVNLQDVTTTYNNTAKRVTTRIDGRVNGQITGDYTEFWTIINDTLSFSSQNQPACTGSASFDYSASVDTVLANVFLTLLDPIADAFNGGAQIDIDAMIDGQVKSLKGPGCYITQMFSQPMLIPGTNFKLMVHYEPQYGRLTVSNGVTIGGLPQMVLREPKVYINSFSGPDTIWAQPNVQPEGDFRVLPHDLRRPLTVLWEAPGAVIFAQGQPRTKIRWNLNVDQINEQYVRQVKVTVTDADGATVTRQESVLIRSNLAQPDPDWNGCLANCADGSQTDISQ